MVDFVLATNSTGTFSETTVLSVLHFGASVSCFERIHPTPTKSESEVLPCEGGC